MKTDMDNLILYFPWAPTLNTYYRHNRGNVHLSRRGRLYKDEVAAALVQQASGIHLDDRLNVECIFYPPDRRRRDLDNHLKALLDSCTLSGLWEDDSLIDQLTLIRGVVVKTGIIRMEVNPAGPLYPYSQHTHI